MPPLFDNRHHRDRFCQHRREELARPLDVSAEMPAKVGQGRRQPCRDVGVLVLASAVELAQLVDERRLACALCRQTLEKFLDRATYSNRVDQPRDSLLDVAPLALGDGAPRRDYAEALAPDRCGPGDRVAE